MVQYFIKEWDGRDVEKIHTCYTIDELWKKLQEIPHKHVSIYRAECVLDWS